MREDFKEVAHTGGKVTFEVNCDKNGQITYQIGYSHINPTPMTLAAIHVHQDGFACGNIKLGGIGTPSTPSPLPNCIMVMLASDSQGKFGHECPKCNKHFRTDNIPANHPLTCPYCGLRTDSFRFLTPSQNDYIRHYLDTFLVGMKSIKRNSSKNIEINMDKVADNTTIGSNKDFYYTSITQQTEFNCSQCNSYNDIRGRYGYCTACGSRNNVQVLKQTFGDISKKLKENTTTPSDALKKSISEFDSSARDYLQQITQRIPMKRKRKKELKRLLFHNLDTFDKVMSEALCINLLQDLTSKRDFISKMFNRRHVFEHRGGVADDKYISNSSDNEIEEGSLIRETEKNVQILLGNLIQMAETLDKDFNEIFPLEQGPIDIEKDRRSRLTNVNT